MGLQPSWQHVHHSYEEDMAQSGRKQRWTVPPSHARDLLLAAGQRPGARDVSTAAHLLRRHWGRCVFQRQSPKQSGQRDSAWGSCASSTLPAVWAEGHGAQTALLDETGLQLRNHKVAANPGPWCGVVCISYSSKPHSTFVKATRSKSWVGKRHLFG